MGTTFVNMAAAVSKIGTFCVHATALETVAAAIGAKSAVLKAVAASLVCQHGTLLDTAVSMMPGVILIMANAAPILSNGARVSVQNVDGQRCGAGLPAGLAAVGRTMMSMMRSRFHSKVRPTLISAGI